MRLINHLRSNLTPLISYYIAIKYYIFLIRLVKKKRIKGEDTGGIKGRLKREAIKNENSELIQF